MFLTLLKPKDLLHHTIPENVTNWYHDRALYSDMYVVEKRSRSSEHIIENCTYAYRFWIEGGSWLGTIPPMLLVLTSLHFKQAHQFHTCHSLFPQRSGEKVVTFQLELLIDCDLKEHLITTRIHNCNLQVQQWLQARKSISELSSQTQVAQMSVQQDFKKEMKSALSPRCH